MPASAGIGLRAAHHADFLEARPDIPWVEVHSENFFADGGRQLQLLDTIRHDYGLSLHGVGLSLGSTDPLDGEHLRRLARLVRRVEPALVSEHVAWGSVAGTFLNDLLPMPCTSEALAQLVSRVGQVQDLLGRQILVENVSSYLQFAGNEMTEWEFLVALARRAGCLLLLDVNNIFVNASNHGFDPLAYLDAIPPELVAEYHIAGHSVVAAAGETLLVDTHDAPVAAAVWQLFAAALLRIGRRPVLLERDARLPPLAALIAEARLADRLMEAGRARVA
ncbi:MAG: DUF692 domain-containing protein [Proteobacteria bacterium]|nr:MAG: DUF692 domain-containing protein [Pseudomonadota bacterium]MBC6944591.1 DUF692 domain-containing protein [Gammaproteobacteria bacterium]MCE7897572.1 DUF692 domain-containing protein [Gammaproteobacteria bacterium PRO8]MDL1881074.1 DUF692 domain-containing protein [Gammaproteobacteria bacterium PRO2]MCL4777454.1 DUF692 domain-containing protein [Gammaproteobacteria bacterium]